VEDFAVGLAEDFAEDFAVDFMEVARCYTWLWRGQRGFRM